VSFLDTVFPFLPRLRKPDGSLADAQCDVAGALRVTLVRELVPSGAFVEPERGVPLTGARAVPGTAGRTVRRALLANSGAQVVWLQLFDLPRAPGTNAQPFLSWPLAPTSAASVEVGRVVLDGLAWAASSTPGLCTPIANAAVWASFSLEPS
jgi:hypothetical protein